LFFCRATSTLKATVPYVRKDIDALLVFRGLGCVADKEILELICYDLNDKKVCIFFLSLSPFIP
jgi:hypothetical protein